MHLLTLLVSFSLFEPFDLLVSTISQTLLDPRSQTHTSRTLLLSLPSPDHSTGKPDFPHPQSFAKIISDI
jgi:hypothetical protein